MLSCVAVYCGRVQRAVQHLALERGKQLYLFGVLLFLNPVAVAQSVYSLSASDEMGSIGSSVEVSVNIDSSQGVDVWGLSLGICSDPSIATPISVVPGAATLAVNNGSFPNYLSFNAGPDGVSGGLAFDFTGVNVLTPGVDQELLVVIYGVSQGATAGLTTSLEFCTSLGAPPVELIIAEQGGVAVVPLVNAGSITAVAAPPAEFIRGDVNEDGVVSVSDAVRLFEELFVGVAGGECSRAGDVNHDHQRDLGDVIFLLGAILLPTQTIDPPFPNCGFGGGMSPLPCTSVPVCP